MEKIIIYGSKYGTTKAYAQELSKKTEIPIIEYSRANCKCASSALYI